MDGDGHQGPKGLGLARTEDLNTNIEKPELKDMSCLPNFQVWDLVIMSILFSTKAGVI